MHLILKTKPKFCHKMLQRFQNSFKTEIGHTVHELRDLFVHVNEAFQCKNKSKVSELSKNLPYVFSEIF